MFTKPLQLLSLTAPMHPLSMYARLNLNVSAVSLILARLAIPPQPTHLSLLNGLYQSRMPDNKTRNLTLLVASLGVRGESGEQATWSPCLFP